MDYLEKLQHAADISGSIVCMGLDPVLEHLPHGEVDTAERIPAFFEQLFTGMKKRNLIPGAFKPNIGFYHCLDKPREGQYQGSQALAGILDMIAALFPGIPVILDCKRGDIARSSENYAAEGFDVWGCDALTVAPYMGSDSVVPFFEHASGVGGGCYVLNRTSNRGAAEFQNLSVGADGTHLYLKTAEKILEWADRFPGTGAVVGATSLAELADLSMYYAEARAPLLIPGVGGQGGNAEDVVSVLRKNSYSLSMVRINSSSGITHPWARENKGCPEDWIGMSMAALQKLNTEIGKLS